MPVMARRQKIELAIYSTMCTYVVVHTFHCTTTTTTTYVVLQVCALHMLL